MVYRSPPTDRTVAVLDLLAADGSGLSAVEVARRLDLSPSTCASLLASLQRAGWTERDADKTYRLGPGLLPVVSAYARRYPLLGAGDDELCRLAADLGADASLTRIDAGALLVVAAAGAGTAGSHLRPGRRFPLDPPYGTVAMAWRPAGEITRWLAGTEPDRRRHYRDVLAAVRARGVAVWRLDPDAGPVAAELRAVLAALGEDPASEALGNRLVALFAGFGRHGFSTAQLDGARRLPVSYVLAPVFGADGSPAYQIELHLLRTVERDAFEAILARLRQAGDRLTAVLGGRAPRAAG